MAIYRIQRIFSRSLPSDWDSDDDAYVEMVEKAKEKITEIKKVNNERVNQRIDNIFGYLWNGQEMDY